jgi:hypothetical protein
VEFISALPLYLTAQKSIVKLTSGFTAWGICIFWLYRRTLLDLAVPAFMPLAFCLYWLRPLLAPASGYCSDCISIHEILVISFRTYRVWAALLRVWVVHYGTVLFLRSNTSAFCLGLYRLRALCTSSLSALQQPLFLNPANSTLSFWTPSF